MEKLCFASHVREMAPRLHRIAYMILRNEADCEDATQEALLRAWRRIHTLRDERYFETWLIRILINECKRLIARNAQARGGHVIGDTAYNPQSHVHDALNALEATYRIPIVLHYVDGYSINEIGKLLRVPATTVKWRLHQGKKRLKAELTEKGAIT